VASGRVPWRTTVDVAADGETVDVVVPALTVAVDGNPRARAGDSTRTAVEWGAAGLGVTGVLLAAGLAVAAKAESNDANAACPMTRCSDLAAVSESRDAAQKADFAQAALVTGAVGLTVAAVLWWTTGTSSRRAAAIPLRWALGPAGVEASW
jgi:hypothetical protein